ncbi:MAG: YlxR family protein [Candidatus Limnocylindrales bacterium]
MAPERSCVACRTARPKLELIRIVRSPSGLVTVDPSGRQNGRGAYVCRDRHCITNAIHRGALSRALEIPVPATLLAEISALSPDLMIQGGPDGQE